MTTARIISDFPEIGKSYFCEKNKGRLILDIEPTPYLDHAKWPDKLPAGNLGKFCYDVLLIATCPAVIETIVNRGL